MIKYILPMIAMISGIPSVNAELYILNDRRFAVQDFSTIDEKTKEHLRKMTQSYYSRASQMPEKKKEISYDKPLEDKIYIIEEMKRSYGDVKDKLNTNIYPVFTDIIPENGCKLAVSSPVGTELPDGTMNGIKSVYDCENKIIAAYEFSYIKQTKNYAIIYAKDQNLYTINNNVIDKSKINYNNASITYLNWMNSKYEMKYEIISFSKEKFDTKKYENIILESSKKIRY